MKPTKFIVEVFINDKASIRIENVEWPEAGEESLLSRLSKHPGVVESLNDRIARETRMSFPVPGIVHLEIETTDYIPPPEPPCYADKEKRAREQADAIYELLMKSDKWELERSRPEVDDPLKNARNDGCCYYKPGRLIFITCRLEMPEED